MVEVKHQNPALNLAVGMEVKPLYPIHIRFKIKMRIIGMYLVLHLL